MTRPRPGGGRGSVAGRGPPAYETPSVLDLLRPASGDAASSPGTGARAAAFHRSRSRVVRLRLGSVGRLADGAAGRLAGGVRGRLASGMAGRLAGGVRGRLASGMAGRLASGVAS